MNDQPWKRYVGAMCREVWDLDRRATEEVMRCIEELIAADGIADPGSVQVFLSVGPSGLSAGRSAMSIRIQTAPGARSAPVAWPPLDFGGGGVAR